MTSWTRKLDLDDPKSKTKRSKPAPKPQAKTGPLSDKQIAAHQKAVIAVARWTTRLKRAANEVAKQQKTVKHYERLIAKNSPSE